MKKKRLLALTLTACVVLAGVSWAGTDEYEGSAGHSEAALTGSGTETASSPNADYIGEASEEPNEASAPNAAAVSQTVQEDTAVTGLRVLCNYAHYVTLSWDAHAVYPYHVVKSNLYRAEENGEFVLLKSVDRWTNTFTDTTGEADTPYRYKVTATIQNDAGEEPIESCGQILEVTVSDQEIIMPAEKDITTGTSEQAEIKFINFNETPNGVWSSSQADLVSVDAAGQVTASKRGDAVITFTTEDGYAVSTKYTCMDAITPPPANMFNAAEWKVFTITNQNRMKEGHLPLTMVPQMQKCTDIRKEELLTKYSHTRPDGTSCFTVFDQVGYNEHGAAGENIAYGYSSPELVMNAWMNSPGHYSNIMDDSFVHFAAGAKNNHWVQMFSGCYDKFNHMELLLPDNLTFKKGTPVENMGIIVGFNCTSHGVSYMPLISQMCTGYDPGTEGQQTVTVTYSSFTDTFPVTVKGGSSGSGGSHSGGGGGGGGSHSGGGGGGGSHSSGGGGTAQGLGNGPASLRGGSLPDYVVKGTWTQAADSHWSFKDSKGVPYINKWAAVENPYANTTSGQAGFDWFFFDGNGNMVTGWQQDGENLFYLNLNSDGTKGRMITGWYWIPDQNGVQKCYYFNPNSDGTRGKLIKNSVVDSYTVNANGEWTVNGVVQTK